MKYVVRSVTEQTKNEKEEKGQKRLRECENFCLIVFLPLSENFVETDLKKD
jgi:hypothetical protein